jgi:coenzyme F420-reducing hydrogenase delta subunit
MNTSVTQQTVAVKLNEEYCSRCSICSSLCPFEAINKEPETGKIVLEIEKCQVCGLCYSTCPAKAISSVYYDIDSLTGYLKRAKQEYESDTLVIMCNGSTPDFGGVEKLFGVSKFIPLFVPCVGRMPEEILLRALTMGIRKIHVLACDDDYCRFDKGGAVAGRKIMALNLLLEQLSYGTDVINLKRNSLKVKVDKDKCITCGNCVFYCPYHAAKLETGAASFDLDLCRGCGLCVALCPAFALELENSEKERISTLISKLSLEMEKPKVLIFRCQWAVLPTVEEDFGSHVRAIDLPCAARVDILHILEAFQNGIDGVLIAACYEEDCKQEKKGSKEAQHQVMVLKERLSQIGLGDRLHFCFIAPRYPEVFTAELGQFAEGIRADFRKGGDE